MERSACLGPFSPKRARRMVRIANRAERAVRAFTQMTLV